MNGPQISVVIPSFDRPKFLKRAIESVLKQSLLPLEIVVVVDGESKQTENMIEIFHDTSPIPVELIQTDVKVGGSEARNIGVRKAKGNWIALLDDDDEWYENKLEKQFELIKKANLTIEEPFLCFTSLHRYKSIHQKQYDKLPNIDFKDSRSNRIVDYLFETKGLRNIGFIQTSTVLVPKWLIEQVPFTKGLPKHQDWDWLLKLDTIEDLKILQVEEPQIIYHSDIPKDKRVGYVNRWRFTEEWGEKNRSRFSDLGYKSFLLNYVLLGVAEDQELSKKERYSLIKAKWKSLGLKATLRPYSWKMLIYMLLSFLKN